jgi:hypothetical protein
MPGSNVFGMELLFARRPLKGAVTHANFFREVMMNVISGGGGFNVGSLGASNSFGGGQDLSTKTNDQLKDMFNNSSSPTDKLGALLQLALNKLNGSEGGGGDIQDLLKQLLQALGGGDSAQGAGGGQGGDLQDLLKQLIQALQGGGDSAQGAGGGEGGGLEDLLKQLIQALQGGGDSAQGAGGSQGGDLKDLLKQLIQALQGGDSGGGDLSLQAGDIE